ncbi:transcriptional regulator, TetR family [Actinomadura meyerae]|uniref:Transcriptional regulator, TetR family n=1 Tax=Actinomadura meyerae TaxID=240840 RepID=A0A239H5V4_9ACTN|nr:TetR/AcrR family transcriptional regulator [Actinomadura meyerae]SNS76750.1 transcriptional regulator, TetR family [Actinomadura meyerae]
MADTEADTAQAAEPATEHAAGQAAGQVPGSAAPVRQSAVERRILDAALRLFAERGFDGTSVQGIVEAAEVTKGALYHYFDSKDDLLYEIYHSLIARQLGDLGAVLSRGLPPREAVRAVLTGLIRSTAEHIDEAKVFAREKDRLDDARMRALRADRRRYHETFRGLIEQGQRGGVFSDATPAETVTIVALGMVNQMPSWYRPDGPKTAERLAEEVAGFVLAALEAPPRP